METEKIISEYQELLYTFLGNVHAGIRWVLLILLVIAVLKAYSKRRGGSVYPGKDPLFKATWIVAVLQLCIGAGLYFTLYFFLKNGGDYSQLPLTESMTSYSLPRVIGILVTTMLVTTGYFRAKRQQELNKGWKTIGLFYLLAIVTLLVSIPWPFLSF